MASAPTIYHPTSRPADEPPWKIAGRETPDWPVLGRFGFPKERAAVRVVIVTGVLVRPEVASRLGPALKRWAEQYERVAGVSMASDVREAIDDIDRVGRSHRQRAERERNTRNTATSWDVHPAVDMADNLLLSTAAAADLLGITERAVRGRLERGSLPGTRTPKGWRIDPTAVALVLADKEAT